MLYLVSMQSIRIAVYNAIILHFLLKISRKITYRPRREPQPKDCVYLFVRDERNPGNEREVLVATVHSDKSYFLRYAFAIEKYLPVKFAAYPITGDCPLPPEISTTDSPFGQIEEMDIMAAVTSATRLFPEITPIWEITPE